MAIVVAQMSTMQNNAAQPTWTTSFPLLPSPGNTIIVVLTAWQTTQPTVATIADNQGVGNSYGLPPNGNTGITATAYIYRCKAIGATSGTFTITVTWTGGTNVYGSIRALDVSGLDPVNIDDQSSATTLSTSTTSHTETIGSQNSNANDLVVGVISPDTGVSSSAITDPATTGYSSIMVQQDSSTYTGGEASYKIISALETSSASWTYASAAAYASVLATFKAAAGGAANVRFYSNGTFQAHQWQEGVVALPFVFRTYANGSALPIRMIEVAGNARLFANGVLQTGKFVEV